MCDEVWHGLGFGFAVNFQGHGIFCDRTRDCFPSSVQIRIIIIIKKVRSLHNLICCLEIFHVAPQCVFECLILIGQIALIIFLKQHL